MRLTGWRASSGAVDPPYDAVQVNYRRVERQEWWLWAAAVVVTLLLTVGLVSFLFPGSHSRDDFYSMYVLPQAVRGLVGLVFLFDIYTLYQQLQIHQIRRRLIEREELFRLIGENAADLIAVVNMEGRRLFNSLSYQRVLGYSPEELKASSSFEQIHPEDRERVKQAAEEARRTGEGRPLEYRIRCKDGGWRVLESTSSVICNSRGVPEKLVVVNRDITERKAAGEALRRSEASFRSVVEDAPYGIFRASMTGQFLRVNPALQDMLGYESAEDLLLASASGHICRQPLECQRMEELLGHVEDFKDFETEWRRKDGSPITVRCSGRRVKDEDGQPAYFEVFAEDVTETRVLERQLRMAQKMEAIGRLSGGIAHDFNNLLGVIIGYSQVLKRALDQATPLFGYAEEVEKAGQRAATLTRQLLAFSRQQVLTPAIMNVNALMTDMGKMLPRLLGEDIEVSMALEPNLGHVKADLGQVEQVVMNLAVNARDAMPSGGKIKIETANVELDVEYTRHHPGSKTGQYVLLAVTDTGTGIAPETMAHIFEPFFTTKERGQGTGLGLATVYGVVKQSGGYIWVDSAPGKGASFQIYLPRVENAVQTAEPTKTAGEILRGTETVLLVEDSEPLRKLARSFLESRGFHVLTAPDGKRALDVARFNPGTIHLLLTDVIMPEMNGRILAEHLALEQSGMKVLYMSGYTDSFIAVHGVLEAGTHLIHKPFTEDSLIRKVREVLDSGKEGAPQPAGELVLAGGPDVSK
jgi:two-component system, cell cycle sensor histidine kinase and response regulator CckA